MKYLWCRIRKHQIVKHKTAVAPWHWCGCLDCGVQWTYYGAVGSTWSRPLDEYAEITVRAEIGGVGLPPLWAYMGREETAAKVRRVAVGVSEKEQEQ